MIKGQSTIEYLMTYGWMLLVVAMIAGALAITVQNQPSFGEKMNQLENKYNKSLEEIETISGLRSCNVVGSDDGISVRGNASMSVSYDCCQTVERGNSTVKYCQQYTSLVRNESFAETYQITN